ncbi:hypothetical protein [Lactobacillus delbrueckii]|uniref:hypothetical protein n=1 Tax=Lactobacillus delbrueckii TaxID=1584 RepID=UPI003852925A
MFKQLRKANQNDYLLITATLILLVVFSLSLLSYVQGQQKAAERDQAQALATGFSRTLKGEIKNTLTLSTTLKELVLASDGKVDNFSTVAKDLLAENTAASNLQLAPKGKVTEIYPLKMKQARSTPFDQPDPGVALPLRDQPPGHRVNRPAQQPPLPTGPGQRGPEE